MTKTNKDKIPGFRNYNKWDKGFRKYREYVSDSYKYIRLGEEGSKYHFDNETPEETRENIAPFLAALIAGAVAIQYVEEKDFYYNNEDMEIIIKFKKTYSGMKKDEITFSLMKDVILLLEKEEQQLIRIANAYDQKE
ncbi:MAG: hypothetical protein LLF83_01645 [Methanobacterium sp.]|nr:hypothetical protein [Methanobacterium sp.]